MNKKGQGEGIMWVVGIFLFALLVAVVIGGIYFLHSLDPWWSSVSGRAQLREAEYSKQIAVQEAQAKFDSSKLLAQAEIERAKGVAEANRIIAGTITESYLKYLFVQGLQTNNMQTIYVPTNNFMPVYDMNNIPK